MTSRDRSFRMFACGLAALILAACAKGGAVDETEAFSPSDELGAVLLGGRLAGPVPFEELEEGAPRLFLSLYDDRTKRLAYNPVNREGAASITLPEDGSRGYRLVTLVPGAYVIASAGAGWIDTEFCNTGRFVVKSGEITYLGHLDLLPENDPNGIRVQVLEGERRIEDAERALTAYPNVKAPIRLARLEIVWRQAGTPSRPEAHCDGARP